ncbi:hypothetical protein G6F63_016146 [Rhizopus arrhizus]|nr:hypothetical protein G6F63_016146 [Rhizopus arrhizus]
MGNAAACSHPVHVARADHLVRAQRVAVADGAGPQIGDGGQADMRVRAHVDGRTGMHECRAHLVDEHERADAACLQGRDGATDFESADVVHARGDDGGHAGVLAGRDQVVVP